MVSNTVMSNLSAVLDRMYVLQTEGSSQKRINQSSDDPLGTAKALSIQSSIASVTQYASNVTRGQGELSYVDSTLNRRQRNHGRGVPRQPCNAGAAGDRQHRVADERVLPEQVCFRGKPDANGAYLGHHFGHGVVSV
jgi:hypothetical protein